ncbi:MAG: GNAT family N-acetyltransferase [Thiomicrorhabdus sp.]|nr:GNAT family N-acetyltransferase [Thiomicrorhabdus sp.]
MRDIQQTTPSITVQKATENDFFEIKHFIKRHKQSRAQLDDTLFITRLNTPSSQAIIGLAKVRNITHTADWLHGVYVEPTWRNQGIAGELMMFIQQQAKNRQMFTFPLPHLKNFYLKQGYQPIEPSELPATLQIRYQNALEHHKKWHCMSLVTTKLAPFHCNKL